MGAGKYKNRVEFQTNSTAVNSDGTPVNVWSELATVWAGVNTVTGREKWANRHTSHNYDAAVSIRYRSDITESMRIIYNGRTLQIKTIIDVNERRRELVLLCVEFRDG